jgi:DNA mismatch repair protein MutS2
VIRQESLNLLEWPRLCLHVSTFAATDLGRAAALNLTIPEQQAATENLLSQTREVYNLELRLARSLSFEGVHDLRESLDRAQRGGVLTGEALIEIATTLAGMRRLRRLIDHQQDVPTLQTLVVDLRTFPDLEQRIHHCIEDSGEVADRASDRLAGLRQQQRSVRNRLIDKLQSLIRLNSNALQENVISRRQDRYVLPVKAGQKGQIPGLVHDSSASGATLYIEPHSTLEWNNQLRQLEKQEAAECETVRQELTLAVSAVVEDLEHVLAIATTLDLATARARYSCWLGANDPRLINRAANEATTLRHLRHPLLVWQERVEGGAAVIPINLMVSPQLRVVAITGPNTGGKTVTLKALGLAVLMAKAGLFVPAREPVELPWFDQVLADIGDEQSIQQSLSTFSGHIRRISRILEALETTPNSLVLLDEVGAGTDPSEGSALAIALLQYLADHAQLTVATTHFGELKALKYQDDRFENASVEFDETSLSPTYRLLWGIPGRSNALAIARRLGLNAAVLEQAETLIDPSRGQDVNTIIASLESQRREQEQKAKEAAQLLARAEQLHFEISRKAEDLRAREHELRQAQEVAVQEAIQEARGEIAHVIRKLKQGPLQGQMAQAATGALQTIATAKLPMAPKAPPKLGFRPKVGDRVRILSLDRVAEVLTPVDADGQLTVRMGILKSVISLGEIESLTGEKPASSEAKSVAKLLETLPEKRAVAAVRTQRNTIDARGLRVADAEVTLEDALNHAQGPLWIIHGHGTGKLRQGIHEFLRHHPLVERFEAAERTDGGTGVTVVYLQ